MKIYIEKDNKKIELSSNEVPQTVEKLLVQLHILAEDVIIVKNGEVVLLDEPLVDSDSLELLSVVSGG